MDRLARELSISPWVWEDQPEPHGFNRTIIAMEQPETECTGMPGGEYVTKEGVELIVAKWGDHHSSPVHGHSDGYIHEHIIYGKMKVNTYRIIDAEARIVRPLRTDIVKQGTFASTFMTSKFPCKEVQPRTQFHVHRQPAPPCTLYLNTQGMAGIINLRCSTSKISTI
jgi:hypothetical protein